MQFEGRVAYVTGAGTGIGADIAKALARRGAAVALVGRSEEKLREVEGEIAAGGGKALVVVADVSNAAAVERSIALTRERLGGLQFAVNNAGVPGQASELALLGEDAWNAVIGTNLTGIYNCLKSELHAMLEGGGGAIVNVSSVFADRGFAGRSAYSASKHGIRGLTRSAAMEYAKKGIRINEVQPGVIAVSRQSSNPEEVSKVAERIPLGRVGTGTEVAAAVCFLLSDEASYVTGAHLAVDGGFLC